MDNQRLNSELRDKLHDLESPFNERVSFEAVMKKRERKKRRAILWIPSMVVVAGLFVVGGLGMLWVQIDQQPEKAPQVAIAKSIVRPSIAKKSTAKSAEEFTVGGKQIEEAKVARKSWEGASLKVTKSHRAVQTNVAQDNALNDVSALNQTNNSNRSLSVNRPGEESLNVSAQSMLQLATEAIAAVKSDKNSTEMLCDPQGLEVVSLGIADPTKTHFEIPEGEYEAQWDPARLQSKWYAEMAATTGSRVVINFNEDDRLSVLGNMYHANYHALLLKDMGNGFMLGGGFSYGEMIGSGEWRIREFQERMNIDSYDLVVMIPPVQTVRVYDTTFSQVRVITTGELAYRIDKFSIPLAARYHFMLGKMSWRVAAQLNPGMTLKTSGDFFSNTEYSPILSQRMLTMDAKFSVGPSISIYKDWTLILEPNMMHHAFRDQKSGKTTGKTLTGFGVSVLHNF